MENTRILYRYSLEHLLEMSPEEDDCHPSNRGRCPMAWEKLIEMRAHEWECTEKEAEDALIAADQALRDYIGANCAVCIARAEGIS